MQHYRDCLAWKPFGALARAISVGLPLDEPSQIIDWENGFSHGQPVPEADRDIEKAPLAIKKATAIPGISVKADEPQWKNKKMRYMQGVYDYEVHNTSTPRVSSCSKREVSKKTPSPRRQSERSIQHLIVKSSP